MLTLLLLEVLAMMFKEFEVPRGTVGTRRSGLLVTELDRVCLGALRGGCDCESCVRSSEDTVQVRIKLLLVLQLQVEVERNPRNQTTNDQPSIASIIP